MSFFNYWLILKSESPKIRCVNIDWLEVYALEDSSCYPLNADYFRNKGIWVKERDYGTRVWSEVFDIYDENHEPWIEVRRAPQSGRSEFKGLVPESVHLRLKNWACYLPDPVERLRCFMLTHGYLFQRIYRIDICLDFREFDSGDKPARFAKRYLERKFAKVNQCKVNVWGDDAWAYFEWESIKWGSPTSMVTTKLYNKTRELSAAKNDKPYIRQAWFDAGLCDNPLNPPDIWRIEFSMKSTANGWIEIEDRDGKRKRKKKIDHNLALFDTKDKLWQRFQELAYHYFSFKHVEYKGERRSLAGIALEAVSAVSDKQRKRKDLCRDKKLFDFNLGATFLHIQGPAPASKPDQDEMILLRRLRYYKNMHSDMQLRQACDVIISQIERHELSRVTSHGLSGEVEALIVAIRSRMGWSYDIAKDTAIKMAKLLKEKEIW